MAQLLSVEQMVHRVYHDEKNTNRIIPIWNLVAEAIKTKDQIQECLVIDAIAVICHLARISEENARFLCQTAKQIYRNGT